MIRLRLRLSREREREMKVIGPVLACLACALISPLSAEPLKIYGIWYEGCEATCKAFAEAIKASGLETELIERDAQQNKALIPGLVQEARDMQADLVTTYGTSATVGAIGRIGDTATAGQITEIPVVFMFVSDPFGSGIAESFERSGRDNVTGTYNRVPEEVNLRAIRSIRPDFRRLGMLYTQSEPNSVAKVDEMKRLAGENGFELVAVEIDPGNADRPDPALLAGQVGKLAAAGVDFLYVGSSSFLSKNGAAFTEAALANRLPVLSPYEELVRDQDALISIAARAEDVGRVGAEQALRILKDGVRPGDLPIARVSDFAYVVNMRVARQLGLFPPMELLQIAETIE